MAPEQPHFTVSIEKVYDLLLDVKSTLDKQHELPEKVGKLEARVSTLERWMWKAVGIAVAFSIVIPIGITIWSKQ